MTRDWDNQRQRFHPPVVDKWDSRFLALADLIATWGKDPSTRVGAVLVNPDRRVIGTGYNGFPAGVADTDERLNDRPTKYAMTIHAEVNAVLNAVAPTAGATCYVTHPPCANCTGVLIQAGIERIVTRAPDAGLAERFRESFNLAHQMRREAWVEIEFLEVV